MIHVLLSVEVQRAGRIAAHQPDGFDDAVRRRRGAVA